MKKNTVRTPKKNKIASVQRYIQFASAHDDTLVLKNGGLRAMIEVDSVNFNLKSEDEQNSIVRAYQQFLNALNFPVQICVRSRKLDIDRYLENLRFRRKNLTNELLKKQMNEYIEYISRLVEYADIMEKKFFVVVPADPPRAQKKGVFGSFMAYIRPDDTVLGVIQRRREFKILKRELDTRSNIVQTALGNCGLSMRKCSTEEIISIFYSAYNPQLSRNQKFEKFKNHQAINPENNLVPDEKTQK